MKIHYLLLIGFIVLGTLARPPVLAADNVDAMLANRDTMIAAVALLTTLPPNCAVDHKPPTGDMIARFILSYGYKGDDAFIAEVKAILKKQEELTKLPESEKTKVLEVMCGWGMLYSLKVRERQSYPPPSPKN
jgi:hypothetical protein